MEELADNQITLNSYEKRVSQYIENTPQVASEEIKLWINTALNLIPANGTVLEIGAGFGREGKYIANLGFDILCTDGTGNFVEILKSKNLKAQQLNILTESISQQYNLILANAVFLHFTTPELIAVLHKVRSALKPKGILAFSVKAGVGEEWSEAKISAPRFFNYWQAEELSQLLDKEGFNCLSVEETLDQLTKVNWIHVIAQIKKVIKT